MIFRNSQPRLAAFTITELLVGMGVFGVFAACMLMGWTALQANALNAAAFAQRQSDQARVLDYIKRDIRRASAVQIYNGATLVTGTASGTELRVTVPDYYTDAREEDNALGTSMPTTPTLSGSSVAYGTAMTVRYYTSNGAVIRNEAGTARTIGEAVGGFVFSFGRETTGEVRCRLSYNQPMRGSGSRILRRQADLLCLQRSDLK